MTRMHLDMQRFVWQLARRAAVGVRNVLCDAEDYAQEGFLELLVSAPRFDPRRGVKPITFFGVRVWGRMVDAQRHGMGRHRAHRQKRLTAKVAARLLSRDAPPAERAERTDLAAFVRSVVARLPEPHRTVIARHYFCGELFRTIAAAIRLSRARTCQLHLAALGMLRIAPLKELARSS